MGRLPEINYNALADALAGAKNRQQLYRAIVDAPFAFKLETARMCLGIIVLLLADKNAQIIRRIALSDTELAKGTMSVSVKPFEAITIPLRYADNLIARAISLGRPQLTTDWYYLFTPALTAAEARLNQAGGAIACSAVYPLSGVIDGGALIFSYYQYPEKLGAIQRTFMKRYSLLVAAHLSGK